MFVQEDRQEKIKFYEEKIKSLFRGLQQLKPEVSVKSFQVNERSEFSLDPEDQQAYRENFLKQITKGPKLKPLRAYPEVLEKEYEIESYSSKGVLLHFKRKLNKELQMMKNLYLRTEVLLKNKNNLKAKERAEDYKEKIRDLENLLSLVNMTNEYNFGTVLPVKDFLKMMEKDKEKLRSLYPFLAFNYYLKWLDVSAKQKALKKFTSLLQKIKNSSISRMKLLTSDPNVGKVKIKVKIITNINAKNIERQKEMMKKIQAQHSTFAEEQYAVNDELLNSHLSDFDLPPVLISGVPQLNTILEAISKEFGLISNLNQDDGHTITNQITYLFPEIFEIQKHKFEMIPYGDQNAKDLMKKKLQKLPVKISTNFATSRKISIKNESEDIRVVYKIVCIKKTDWVWKIVPKKCEWEKRQESRLKGISKNDALLENSFHVLSIQNLGAQIKLLEEYSMIYPEKTTKKGRMRHELGDSQNEVKQKYLQGLLDDKLSSQMNEAEPINLSTYNIKSIYTLKLLKSREMKFKIIQILNVFRSYEKMFSLDLENFEKINSNSQKFRDGLNDTVEQIDKEVYVKDSSEEYVLYDKTLEDYIELENWLIQLGTFFIEKHEVVLDHTSNQYPPIDREFLLAELLEEEFNFSQRKLQLVMVLVKIYKNTAKVKFNIRIAELITRIMHMRPRLNLTNSYFSQSYWAHCEALKAESQFLSTFSNVFSKKKPEENFALVKVIKVISSIEMMIEDYCLDFHIDCSKEKSLIEAVIWEEATLKLIDFTGFGYEYKNQMDWNVFALAMNEIFEESTKGKLRVNNVEVTYNDICLNIFNFIMGFKKLVIANLHSKVLKEVYNEMLYKPKKEELSSLEPFTQIPVSKNQIFFSVFELFPELSKVLNLKSQEDLKNLISGSSFGLFNSIVKYEIWNKQFTQIAVQVNSVLMEKYLRNITELEIAQEQSFILKNSKVNWMIILGRKGEGIIPEKAQQEIKRLNNKVQTLSGIIDVMSIKIQKRELVKLKENFTYAEVLSLYCDDIKFELYEKALACQILKIIKQIYQTLSVIPGKILEPILSKVSKKAKPSSISYYNLNTLDYLESCLFGLLNKSEKLDKNLDVIFNDILSLQRYTQIQILARFLSIPKVLFLELNELSSIKKTVYYEEPDETLPKEISDNQEIKVFTEVIIDILNIKTNDWASYLNRAFYLLSISIYGLISKLLEEGNEDELRIFREIAEDLFGFQYRKNFAELHKKSIITVCEQFYVHHKRPKYSQKIFGGFLNSLAFSFMELADESRREIHQFFFSPQNQNLSPISQIENKLKILILRSLFIEYKASQSDFKIKYADCLQLYNDFLESPYGEIDEDTKIQLLKNYFLEEICLFGASCLEQLYDNYNTRQPTQSTSYFSCNFDHNENDSSAKIGALQTFANSLRNKASRVETPTSGFAMVFYLKDMTSAMRKLMSGYLEFNETPYFSQVEQLKLQIEFLKNKHENIEKISDYYSKEAENIVKNFDTIVNLTVTQKGSEIIYSLDLIRRQLKEIQENTKQLETYTRVIVDSEFKERMQTKERQIKDFLLSFKSFQDEIAQNVTNVLESNVSSGISSIFPYSSKLKRQKIKEIYTDTKENVKDRRKIEKKRLNNELISLKIFNRWASVFNKEKIDKEVSKLKSQLNSNQVIWEELNHTQRRETILKQELANSQTVLSGSEKNIEKLQKEIEEINSARLRLQMFKDKKLKQTEQLKQFMKIEKQAKEKQENLSKIMNNQIKIKEMQMNEVNAAQEYVQIAEKYEEECKRLKRDIESLRRAKEDAFDRLENLRKTIESKNDATWKDKFVNLSRNLTDSTSKSFIYSSSRTPLKMNESFNTISYKSKSPTLPKISNRSFKYN